MRSTTTSFHHLPFSPPIVFTFNPTSSRRLKESKYLHLAPYLPIRIENIILTLFALLFSIDFSTRCSTTRWCFTCAWFVSSSMSQWPESKFSYLSWQSAMKNDFFVKLPLGIKLSVLYHRFYLRPPYFREQSMRVSSKNWLTLACYMIYTLRAVASMHTSRIYPCRMWSCRPTKRCVTTIILHNLDFTRKY